MKKLKRGITLLRRGIAHLTHKKIVNIDNKKLVSFTFDDAPESAIINAGSSLYNNGYLGTFYISTLYMGEKNEKKLFSKESLQNIIDDGHEIGGHTHSHLSALKDTHETFIKDEKKNREELKKLGVNIENFAYPYGHQTFTVKKISGEKYRSCRGVLKGINRGRVDFNNLKAIRLYEDKYPLSHIYNVLEEFNKTGGWLIFYTHDVDENYSNVGCSPTYFEKVVQKTKELNLNVQTINNAINIINQ
jgi:peptidoglycan/xylan/chitin deacetylase (PgdA/CDA1 family)